MKRNESWQVPGCEEDRDGGGRKGGVRREGKGGREGGGSRREGEGRGSGGSQHSLIWASGCQSGRCV